MVSPNETAIAHHLSVVKKVRLSTGEVELTGLMVCLTLLLCISSWS